MFNVKLKKVSTGQLIEYFTIEKKTNGYKFLYSNGYEEVIL